MNTGLNANDEVQTPDGYEPPRVEQVITSEDLAREILYAGIPSEVTPIG